TAQTCRACHPAQPPVVLFLLAGGEVADSICADAETVPSLASHPKEKQKSDRAENNQRQSECETNLQPLKKRAPIAALICASRRIRQRCLAGGRLGCLQSAALVAVLGARVV